MFERQYQTLLQEILANGEEVLDDRTGVGTIKVFGRTMKWDLAHGFPADTLRKVALRIAFEETMFFARGETDTKLLEAKKINIWKGNTTREFLDNRGLHELPEGNMGRGYGVQWRDFRGVKVLECGDNVEHKTGTTTCFNAKVQIKSVDQISELLKGLKENPSGRRHLVTAWNPAELDQMALPPCHLLHQYGIQNGRLDSLFFMRSSDVVYGLPYNLMSYAFLNEAFSKILRVQPGVMTYMAGDCHIYKNQLEMAKDMAYNRTPPPLPNIMIHKDLNNVDDFLNLEWSDIELLDYNPLPDYKDKPPMAV